MIQTTQTYSADRAKILSTIPEFNRLTGNSEKICETKEKILLVADTDTTLIFFGESGTGKSIAAQLVHELSPRKASPFVIVNMANNNKDLLESILFGTVKGAFTDAKPREGLFKIADGGTLFMDEIADMPLESQAKILHVIETGRFRPVGADEESKTDVRLVFATNADLWQKVKSGAFREDLYWRIMDFPIEIPSLRERTEDIPDLVKYSLNEIKYKYNIDFEITESALKKLHTCQWPGNFRQFRSCMRRAALLSRYTGVIDHDAIIF